MTELEEIELRLTTLQESNQIIWQENYETTGTLEDMKKRDQRILEWLRNCNEMALLFHRKAVLKRKGRK